MKKLIIGLLIVLVLIGGAFVAAYIYLDTIVCDGIVYGTTQATGTPTQLHAARLGLLQGTLELDDLGIGNPQGFESDQFLTLKSGGVTVSLGSLREETIEIPTIAFDGLDIYLERRGGEENFRVIMANLKRLSSEQPEPTTDEPGKQYVVRRLAIQNTTVHISGYPVQADPIKLPPIVLENVGSDSDQGVMMSQLTGIILREIMDQVMKNPGQLPGVLLSSLGSGLDGLGGLGEVGSVQIGKIGDSLNELLGDQAGPLTDIVGSEGVVGEALGEGTEATEDLGKTVEDAGEQLQRGIGGLLGGDKDDENEDNNEN